MNSVYQIVTDRIVKKIEEEKILPWHKPWNQAIGMPKNAISKKAYSGINTFILATSEHNLSEYWLTWNQVSSLGGKVKVEHNKNYEIVVFWALLKTKKKTSDESEKTFPMLRYYRVYNTSQCDFPENVAKRFEAKKPSENPINRLEHVEEVINGYLTKEHIHVVNGNGRAYYSPLMDNIGMPPAEAFTMTEEYYSTLFHEAAHSTGADKRLKRFTPGESSIFGSDAYSKEELVAEMTASFLNAEFGLAGTFDNSVAYLNNWLGKFKSDPQMLVSAASKASKAAEFILKGKEVEEEVAETEE